MRLTPLAVFLAGVTDLSLKKHLIKMEQSMTHANRLAQDAAFIYCEAIGYLLNNS